MLNVLPISVLVEFIPVISKQLSKSTLASCSCLQANMSKKRKGNKACKEIKEQESKVCSFHHFTASEIEDLQKSLLLWYDTKQRVLPWRQVNPTDNNTRAYGVWVSEIMLQQTQVATVIDYYNRWMKTWPSIEDLATATVEEVNTLWSGLGYYSRGRRLLEGAQKVVNEMGGKMPNTAEDLQKLLPGVGRYTAGAVASIAFGQVTGLVDGNVMRVLSRMRLIGSYITQPNAIEKFWSLANEIVDSDRPGDFNQAVMELGATVCMPKTPNCSQCPVRSLCHSYTKVDHESKKSIQSTLKTMVKSERKLDIPDIENIVPNCSLCSDQKWDISLGVTNFPRKPPKAKARLEDLYVLVLRKVTERSDKCKHYWMIQRPNKGLLAGLWEFPVRMCKDEAKALKSVLKEDFKIDLQYSKSLHDCGQITHMFSHIHHNYRVLSMDIQECTFDDQVLNPEGRDTKWVSEKDLKDSAISTGMRKVLKLCQDVSSKSSKKRKCESKSEQNKKKSQPSISSFFKPSKGKG